MKHLTNEFLTDFLIHLKDYQEFPTAKVGEIFMYPDRFFQSLAADKRAKPKTNVEALNFRNLIISQRSANKQINVSTKFPEYFKLVEFLETHKYVELKSGMKNIKYVVNITSQAIHAIQNNQPFNFSPNTNQTVHNTTNNTTTIGGNNITAGNNSNINTGNLQDISGNANIGNANSSGEHPTITVDGHKNNTNFNQNPKEKKGWLSKLLKYIIPLIVILSLLLSNYREQIFNQIF